MSKKNQAWEKGKNQKKEAKVSRVHKSSFRFILVAAGEFRISPFHSSIGDTTCIIEPLVVV